MAEIAELPAGFADRVLGAQSTFRFVMEAMARPGSVQRITADVGAPWPVMRGTAAIALTLFDHDTPIWLDHRMAEAASVARWLRFHTSVPVITDASVSQFALIGDGDALPGLDCFCLGSNEYPDRSTTLILQVESLTKGPAYVLQGPGIEAWLEHDMQGPGDWPEATFVAVAGDEVVGYAKFSISSTSATSAYHDLTAVKRDWRGRGVARALKTAQIGWAKANGYELLRTTNDERNTPMRRLNEQLGYRPWIGRLFLRGVPCVGDREERRFGNPQGEGSAQAHGHNAVLLSPENQRRSGDVLELSLQPVEAKQAR